MKSSTRADHELVAAIERAGRRNRGRAKRRDSWERELWSAYVRDGSRAPPANEPPHTAA